jgi:hypothetical protein
MHPFKKVIVGLFVVYGINQLTCYLYGEAALAKKLVGDAQTTFRHSPFGHANHVNLFYNSTINPNNARSLEAIYQGTQKTVKLIRIDDWEELSPYRDKFDVYNHLLWFESSLLTPLVTVSENEYIKEYAYTQHWGHQYIWVLTKWIKISDE